MSMSRGSAPIFASCGMMSSSGSEAHLEVVSGSAEAAPRVDRQVGVRAEVEQHVTALVLDQEDVERERERLADPRVERIDQRPGGDHATDVERVQLHRPPSRSSASKRPDQGADTTMKRRLPRLRARGDAMTMQHDLRFSVLVLPNVEWDELLRRCRQVEELGFDSVGLADHLVDWAGGKGPWFELWTQLSAIAMATTRIRLTTLVAQIPFRNPALFALQALTADHVSGGRLDIGLGTGLGIDPSYRMMGIENWSAGNALRDSASTSRSSTGCCRRRRRRSAGDYYQVDRAALRPRPVQSPRPPIMVAAMAPMMLGHAARYADIWNSLSFAGTFAEQIEETRQRIAAIDARCAAIGRDPASLRRSYLMFDPTARSSGGVIAYYESEETFTRMVQRGDRARYLGDRALLPAARGSDADVRAHRA